MGKVELFKLLFRREYALDLLSQGFVSGFLIVEIFGALRGIVNDLCNLSRFKGILLQLLQAYLCLVHAILA